MTTRRDLLVALGAALVGSGGTYLTQAAAQGRDLDALRRRVTELSYNVASGGGVNRKLMPDPTSGRPTVPLDEIFTFDRNHAMCRVDTNPQAFMMPTYAMGNVVVDANRFFMAMITTTVDQFIVSTQPDGKRKVVMRGGLSCSTELGQARTTLGSRSASEHATYEIEAIDGGVGGRKAGDSFAFTAFFDANEATLNHAIFGPRSTFTGDLIEGEVTIVDPTRSP